MALTFPSSPTDGQIYIDTVSGRRYRYIGSAGVWSFAANNVGLTVSSIPPANTAPGAMWYNKEIGRTFLYYDDGDSKQWVEIVPGTGSFDSSTIAGYANAATVIAVAPAYNTANAAYGVANAGFGKANTALQNTNVTLAGNLTVTGTHTLVQVPNYRNTPNISADYTISNTYNEMSIGPINIANGVTVIVDNNANWVIV